MKKQSAHMNQRKIAATQSRDKVSCQFYTAPWSFKIMRCEELALDKASFKPYYL
jgi:hypothetical protein